jgi:hypothetical protein
MKKRKDRVWYYQQGGPVKGSKVDAVSGAARNVNQSAYDYNMFFGPMEGNMRMLADSANRIDPSLASPLHPEGRPQNMKLAMGAYGAVNNLGNYTDTPALYGVRGGTPPKMGKDAENFQNFFNSLTPDQIGVMAKQRDKGFGKSMKDKISLAKELKLKPNQAIPAYKAYKFAQDNNLPLFSLGGILQDTAGGASLGTAVPGIGNVVGGLIGAGAGLVKGTFSHFRDKKKEKEAEEGAQEIRDKGIATMQQTGSINNYIPTFEDGGVMPYGMLNAELEKEEVTNAPNGTMKKFNLPTHKGATSANRMSLQPGTQVFSDQLKTSKGKTFAEEADVIRKRKDKLQSILNNPKATTLAKKTAERSLSNVESTLQSLFAQQEAMKPAQNMSYDGIQMAPFGGFIEGVGKFLKSDMAKQLGQTALELAPVGYNLITGMGKEEKMNAPDYYNPQANKAMSLMSNRRANIDPMLESNRAAQGMYNKNISNLGRSAGFQAANLQAGQLARMSGDAAARAQKINMDNAYLGEEAQFRAGIGSEMANTNLTVSDLNSRNSAARRAFLGQGLNDMSQYAQRNRLMKNQEARDDMRWNEWMDYNKNYIGGGMGSGGFGTPQEMMSAPQPNNYQKYRLRGTNTGLNRLHSKG